MSAQPTRSELLDRLWVCQDAKGYISDADVQRLAKTFDLSQVDIEGCLSFYHFFSRKPTGRYCIYLNNSILAEHAGYAEVLQAFQEATGAVVGHVSPDGLFGLYTTACIGLSDQEPAALINWQPFVKLSPERVHQIVRQLRAGKPLVQLSDPVPDQLRFVPRDAALTFFRDHQSGVALEPLRQMSPVEVIEAIKTSRLTGRGGAFFPTGLKWEFCREHEGDAHYVVCNADEGEPGTFKDRVLMHRLPGLMIEGMIIGGYAIGAEEGIIYLRAEYRWLKHRLEEAIAEYEELGWLGERLPTQEPCKFRIRIQLGAGAYVCGEETALLESLEGKRGEPRNKTFFPVERGYLGQPTIVNNVETFCAAARILELGAERFAHLGTKQSAGTKVLCVAGDCERPGIYEIEWGMTIEELLDLCGAPDAQIIQLSGPSGQIINREDFKRRISRDDLICGGSVMIFNHERDLLQILLNFQQFFRRESCGVCTPCRVGNFVLSRKLERMARGLTTRDDIKEVRQWGTLLKQSSRCGLGQTATNTLKMALDKFPDYFEGLLESSHATFERGFDLNSALEDYRSIAKTQPYEAG